MKQGKRIISLVLVGASIMSLTGCSSIIGGAENYPLVSATTSSELRDYYAKALEYDSIISRNIEVHETNYELKDVSEEKAAVLTELTGKAQDILGKTEYELSEENLELVSEDTYNYIKAFLNDKTLNGGDITSIQGALGYYFVKVNYTLSNANIGDYTSYANLVGIHGAFYEDVFGEDQVDTAYLSTAADRMNDYYEENKIFKKASFNEGDMTFSIENTDSITVEESIEEAPVEESAEAPNTGTLEMPDGTSVDVIDENGDVIEDTTEEEAVETTDITEDMTALETAESTDGATTTHNERRVQSLPASVVNSVAGSSVRQTAYMHDIDIVFNRPEANGTISGIGLWSTGTDGLTLFGFDKSAVGGTVELTYVFKEAFDGSGEIVGYNIYPSSFELTSGITSSNGNTTIPEYLMEELEILLERSDRAIVNGDITALVSSTIYADMGMGMLRGYEEQSTNLLKHMSTIRRVISRDIANNAYLLEVETTRQEGPKDVDVYGTYRDKYLITIEQIDGEFYITDSVLTSRTVTKVPEINPESSATKRLAALNLTGEVSDSTKKAVEELLSSLYNAGTIRLLHGPKEINGQMVERGMYDCFNDNTEMLSSDDLEYYNSSIRDELMKYGSNVASTFAGTVTEWIGGTDNQVEFTTEELIVYKGRNTGVYRQCYYLVSCMEDKWVIDEITVLETSEIEGSDVTTVKERIGSDKFTY